MMMGERGGAGSKGGGNVDKGRHHHREYTRMSAQTKQRENDGVK